MSSAAPVVNEFVSTDELARAAARNDAAAVQSNVSITVERASDSRLAGIEPEWRELLTRAHEPNVFMDPALARLAGESCVPLLAWSGEHRLLGVWVFSIARRSSLRVLQSPAFSHAYLATPVIDRDCAEAVLAAMLDFIACDASLPKQVALDPIRSDGPTMRALARVLAARKTPLCVLQEAKRPVLASRLDAKQYFEKALSASSRKKLRQHRRRLEEKGALESRVDVAPEQVSGAFEQFLKLEAAGWKGRRGTALLCEAADVAFSREMIARLAARGDASIHGLYQQGNAVALQVVLRAGANAFTWKTAYDEALADFSPGMLLLEDYTAAFLADRSITLVDSCAFDDSGFMSAWSERETIASVLFDARQGGSVTSVAHALLQKAILVLRARAKAIYLEGRRRWKRR